MKRLPIVDFVRSGCKLVNPIEVFFEIYTETKGQPCVGCGYRTGCQVRHKLETGQHKTVRRINKPVETNKQIAERLGITPRQVTKMRKAGTL